MAVALFGSVLPLSFVVLLLAAEDSVAMFLVVLPLAIVISSAFIVIVDSVSIFDSFAEESFVDFSALEDIDSLSMKEVVFPASEVDISDGVFEDSFSVSGFVVSLSDVVAIDVGHFYGVW